ncbi:ras-related protein Rab-22A-like isoform X2 [Dermacentor variabilis]|uniref:ras-related protein Rab-22A-like isoform X2 n=1 Tax=Dermacentor variabilis TaxID=34621 RepID=UPI003F5BCB8A
MSEYYYDSGVGKSSILQRFVYNTFNSSAESTIGASFMMKNLVLHDRTFKFNIWDTAGQERYRALAPMYYRGAGAAVIVYDITSMESFNAVQSWVRELQLHGDPNIALGIAGNKCDLEDHRELESHMPTSMAQFLLRLVLLRPLISRNFSWELVDHLCAPLILSHLAHVLGIYHLLLYKRATTDWAPQQVIAASCFTS